MYPLRMIYIASLCILGVVLASIVYLIQGDSTKYTEITQAEMIKLDDGWVIQIDLNNPDEQNRVYNVSVNIDNGRSENNDILIQPHSKFQYRYKTDAEEQRSITFKVNRTGDPALPWVQEFRHYQ